MFSTLDRYSYWFWSLVSQVTAHPGTFGPPSHGNQYRGVMLCGFVGKMCFILILTRLVNTCVVDSLFYTLMQACFGRLDPDLQAQEHRDVDTVGTSGGHCGHKWWTQKWFYGHNLWRWLVASGFGYSNCCVPLF